VPHPFTLSTSRLLPCRAAALPMRTYRAAALLPSPARRFAPRGAPQVHWPPGLLSCSPADLHTRWHAALLACCLAHLLACCHASLLTCRPVDLLPCCPHLLTFCLAGPLACSSLACSPADSLTCWPAHLQTCCLDALLASLLPCPLPSLAGLLYDVFPTFIRCPLPCTAGFHLNRRCCCQNCKYL
jgi:hypothetical protein